MNNRVFAEDMALVIGSADKVPTKLEFPLFISKDFRDVSVLVLSLSNRAINVLGRNKVVTLGDLMDRFDEVPRFRNCGEGTSREIKNEFLAFWYNNLEPEDITRFWEEFIDVNGMAA